METNKPEKTTELPEDFSFSFSSLSKLMKDPKLFYKEYILGDRQKIDAKHFKEGELLHCFVLEPENFDDKFTVMPKKVPGGTLKVIIDRIWELYGKDKQEQLNNIIPPAPVEQRTYLADWKDQILEELINENLYQTLTDAKKADINGNKLTGDQKRLEKCINNDTLNYWTALRSSTNKTIVDLDMIQKSKAKANVILTDENVKPLISGEDLKNKILKEVELECELKKYNFGLKGILDCVRVDYKNETLYITDLKTTSKDLKDFIDSVETYNYWLQAVIYKELVLSLVPADSKKAWKLKFNFVVIDKNNLVYPFEVQPETLAKWEIKTKEIFDKAQWHVNTNNYNLPYDYENNLIKL